jgi:hypothetical protein
MSEMHETAPHLKPQQVPHAPEGEKNKMVIMYDSD